jgi:hypothetical protein
MPSRERGFETLLISSLGDVERLRSSPTRLWMLHGPVELRIPHLAQPARERFESRLNELAGICGCAEGAVGGAAVLIAIAVFWFAREPAFSWQSVLVAGMTVIGSALLAKLVIVIIARVRLRHALGNLLRTASGDVRPDHQGTAP